MLTGGTFFLFIVTLIISGALALIEIIRKKNPELAKAIESLSSFAGWVGLGLVIFCVITLGDVLSGLKLLFRVIPVSTIVLLAALVAGIGLGLFQLIGLLKQFKIVSEDKLAGLEEKLAQIKIPLGFLSIGAGVYLLLWRIIKWSF